ncbi:MAG: hypothetical protein AAGF83_25365 [Cyanobacteria bacterium P01_G01_bin.67]
MNTTTTAIKSVDNSLEVLAQFGIELDLEEFLVEELEQGLSSDISNGF